MRSYYFSVRLLENGRMVITPHAGLSTKVEDAVLVGVDELVEYVNEIIKKEDS